MCSISWFIADAGLQFTNRCELSCDGNLRTRKSSADSVIHPNVLVQFFPAQRKAVQTQLYFLQKFLGGFGKQWKLCNGKTYEPAVGKFQAYAACFHPAAHGDGFSFRFSDHVIEY